MASEMPSQVLQGCCLSMCPPSEMTLRNREGLVHPMECRPQLPKTGPQQTSDKNGGNPHSGKKGKKSLSIKGDPQYFVKEFARSSAGREIRACDVRSLPVLVRTIRYLLTECEPLLIPSLIIVGLVAIVCTL
ncbi:SAC3/GANP/THP3 [Trinorchestia longiramus]|nr:SAC3/GANP/THP3 [Trinorchestia longiramus]